MSCQSSSLENVMKLLKSSLNSDDYYCLLLKLLCIRAP